MLKTHTTYSCIMSRPPPPLKKREYFLRCHQKNSCILFGKSQKAAKMVSKGFRIVAVQNPAADAK